MKKFICTIILVTISLAAFSEEGEAGWRRRGWYMRNPDAHCVMRKLVVSGPYGRMNVQRIRVCG